MEQPGDNIDHVNLDVNQGSIIFDKYNCKLAVNRQKSQQNQQNRLQSKLLESPLFMFRNALKPRSQSLNWV